MSPTRKLEADMSKSDVQQAVKRAEKQVANTSAGGHLGGTYYGQQPDGKTASTNSNVGKARPNDGNS
jgi:phage-related minor tail protein